MSLWDELHEQPRTIATALASARDRRDQIAGLLDDDVVHAVLAARGTSDNAARFAQYLWGARNRLPVALTTPSLFADGDGPRLDGALVVGVSQSGQSPDLVGVLEAARRQGRPRITVTNDPASPLAQAADVVVDLACGPELAVAATKSYTAELAALATMSDALPGADDTRLVAALNEVPGAVAQVLHEGDVGPLVELLAATDRCAIVGRGLDLATAGEWALKLQELAGVLAHAWSSSDFRHGPIALAAAAMPVVVVATDPRHVDEGVTLAADVRDRGGRPLLVTDAETAVDGVEVLRLPAAGPLAGPFTAIVAAQLATYHATVARGLDPDAPAGLQKVTRTR